VSRIDEALRRTKDGGEEVAPVADDQVLFRPAWPASSLDVSHGELRESAHADDRLVESTTDLPASFPGVMGFSSAWRERLASGADGNPGLVEQFRRLAGTLCQAQKANRIRSVMVTSASPADGKTLTSINLSLVLAESYRCRVLLVDADLRRPSIPSVVDLGGGSGLSEALRAATEQRLALVPIAPRLTLLPAGQPIANSIEALTSPRMRQILDEAVTRFDWVILDAPPAGPTADARLLAQMVDGALFVVRAGRTQYSAIQQALDALGRERLLGVVLNGVDLKPLDGYYGTPRNDETSQGSYAR
jgi:capsular exopolysaccharide synthesis family protein